MTPQANAENTNGRCKVLSKTLLSTLAAFLLLGGNARGDLEGSASVQIHATADFHAPLAAHGVWVEAGSHGRCWKPSHVAVGWRPYSTGSWIWTDSGWYWASDEPWAWACYHYGRWHYDGHAGWVWIPGVEWGPAWVSWRVGRGHIGWAPLPPAGTFGVKVAAPAHFVFVGTGHFTDPIHPSKVIVNNAAILKESKELNNIARENRKFEGGSRKVVVNHGPQVDMIEKSAGKSIKPVPIHEAAAHTRVPPEVARSPRNSNDPNAKGVNNKDHGNYQSHGVSAGPDKNGWASDHGRSPDAGRGGFGGVSGRGGGHGGRGKGR